MAGEAPCRPRDFAPRDPTAPGVAVVNEAFARKYLPDADPIGAEIRLGTGESDRERVQIVGVAEDAAFVSV